MEEARFKGETLRFGVYDEPRWVCVSDEGTCVWHAGWPPRLRSIVARIALLGMEGA